MKRLLTVLIFMGIHNNDSDIVGSYQCAAAAGSCNLINTADKSGADKAGDLINNADSQNPIEYGCIKVNKGNACKRIVFLIQIGIELPLNVYSLENNPMEYAEIKSPGGA